MIGDAPHTGCFLHEGQSKGLTEKAFCKAMILKGRKTGLLRLDGRLAFVSGFLFDVVTPPAEFGAAIGEI